MTFNIEVPCTLIFQPGIVLLKCGSNAFDLAKLDTVDELRVLLYGLASGAIQSIAGDAASKIAGTAPTKSEAAATMAEAFRRQAERSKQHLADAQKTYEAAVESLGK